MINHTRVIAAVASAPWRAVRRGMSAATESARTGAVRGLLANAGLARGPRGSARLTPQQIEQFRRALKAVEGADLAKQVRVTAELVSIQTRLVREAPDLASRLVRERWIGELLFMRAGTAFVPSWARRHADRVLRLNPNGHRLAIQK